MKIILRVFLFMLITGSLSAQSISGYQYRGSFDPAQNAVVNSNQFNGYSNHWQDVYKKWVRYGKLYKISMPDLAPDKNGKPTRQIPVWMPTVTARVAFLANVPARVSRVFLVYYNNKNGMAKTYTIDLHVGGRPPDCR